MTTRRQALVREQLPALAFVPSYGIGTGGQRGAKDHAKGMAGDLRSNVSGFRQVAPPIFSLFPCTEGRSRECAPKRMGLLKVQGNFHFPAVPVGALPWSCV